MLSSYNKLDAHKALIRCAKYVDKMNCFVTGGEDNKICIWKFDPFNNEHNDINNDIDNDNGPAVIRMNDNILFSGYSAHHRKDKTFKHKSANHFSPY